MTSTPRSRAGLYSGAAPRLHSDAPGAPIVQPASRQTMMTSENSIPPADGVYRRFISIRDWLERCPLSILQLGMRIGVGMVFFKAGLLKYQSFEFAVKLFEDEYKVPFLAPAVAARMAMINELTTSTLLFLGLATRLTTLPLFGMISVIQIFVYPNAWPDHVL